VTAKVAEHRLAKPVAAKVTEDLEAVSAGQHDVQDNGVGKLRRSEIVSLLARRRRHGLEPFFLQPSS
jgi:hypothetical protein